MIKPEPQIIKSLAMASRQYPELLEWMKGIQKREVERLPWALDNLAIKQGRCQMIIELIEFIEQTPAIAAKL